VADDEYEEKETILVLWMVEEGRD